MALATGCGGKAEPEPSPTHSATVEKQPAAPSPELSRLLAIDAQLKGSSSFEVSMYLLPAKPGLELSGAPDGEVDRVRKKLADYQSLIGESIPLIAATISQEHAPAPVDTLPSALGLILTSDAARCWDDGDPSGAAKRLLAAVRLGRMLLASDAESAQFQGGLMIQRALMRAKAQCEGGLSTRIDAELRQALVAELDGFDRADPVGTLARWRTSATATLESARLRYVGRDAGKLLAQDIDTNGADTDDFVSVGMPPEIAAAFKGTVPVRVGLETVRKMPASAIAGHIKNAEALVDAVSQALAQPDPLPQLRELQPKIAQDPSQVARLILGSPAATYINMKTQTDLFSAVRQCLAR